MTPERKAELRDAKISMPWKASAIIAECFDYIDKLEEVALAADANVQSMEYMKTLLRLMLPCRSGSCLCDKCLSEWIDVITTEADHED